MSNKPVDLVNEVGGGLHVLLLGAGASLAALPDGDANGRKIPLMKDLAEVLELEEKISHFGISPPYDDFEGIYSELSKKVECSSLVKEIEFRIYEYFSSLRLPNQPTIYDHIVLFLREKDFIATFNWDPLLMQAIERNEHIARSPHVSTLHGNVGIGYCNLHDGKMTYGHAGWLCGVCECQFKNN